MKLTVQEWIFCITLQWFLLFSTKLDWRRFEHEESQKNKRPTTDTVRLSFPKTGKNDQNAWTTQWCDAIKKKCHHFFIQLLCGSVHISWTTHKQKRINSLLPVHRTHKCIVQRPGTGRIMWERNTLRVHVWRSFRLAVWAVMTPVPCVGFIFLFPTLLKN